MSATTLENPGTAARALPVTGLTARACLAMTRAATRTPLGRVLNMSDRALGNRFASSENYVADRQSNVDAYERLFLPFAPFAGKDVFDLGCSTGYLLDAFRQRWPFRGIGGDISTEALATAKARYPGTLFLQTTPTSIPLPTESVDVIYTIDTVEHLSRPREILLECHRILRPGGRMLVHFCPWLNPWGSHLEDTIPVPWVHTVFSMDTLLRVAAHLYEQPDHPTAWYWLDPETSQKKPNPYLDRERWREFLNFMTLSRFRRLLKTLPFEPVHVQPIGFGGKAYKVGALLRGLARVPVLDEFFTSASFWVLEKRRPSAA